MRYSPYVNLLLLVLFVLPSCTGFKDPGEKESEAKPMTRDPAAEAIKLGTSDQLFAYQYIENGQAGEKEFSRVSLLTNQGGTWYRHQEIYNIYENARGEKEYFVLEFDLNPKDSVNRQQVSEYQVLQTPDSAYISMASQSDILLVKTLSLSFGNHHYRLFQLEGFAHQDDPDPAHYKFWSPELGTVLIWYGEKYSFELVSTPDPAEQPLLEALKALARAQVKI